jgi:hypothetical protein
LKDLPASYIYENVLKVFIEGSEGAEKYRELIDYYYKTNAKHRQNLQKSPKLTIKKLQEKALKYSFSQTSKEKKLHLESDNFISTSATKEAEKN